MTWGMASGTLRLKAQARSQSASNTAAIKGGMAQTRTAPTKVRTSQRWIGSLRQGRARPTSTSTSGYSHTMSNRVGASRAVKAPPTTPPSDISR